MDYIPGAHSAAQFLGLEERASVHSHGSHHLVPFLHAKDDENKDDKDNSPGPLGRIANVVTASANEAVTSAVTNMMSHTSHDHNDDDRHHIFRRDSSATDVGLAGKMANLATAVVKEKIVKTALHSGDDDDDNAKKDDADKEPGMLRSALQTVTGGMLGGTSAAALEHHHHRDKDDDKPGILGSAADAASTALATVTGGILGSTAAHEHHKDSSHHHHGHHHRHSHNDKDDDPGIIGSAVNAASTAATTAIGGMLLLGSELGSSSHDHDKKHRKHKAGHVDEDRGHARTALETVTGGLLRNKHKKRDKHHESSESDDSRGSGHHHHHHHGIIGAAKDMLGDATGGFIGTVAADEAERHHDKEHGEGHGVHHKRNILETVTGGLLGTAAADEAESHHHKADRQDHHGHHHHRHRFIEKVTGGLIGIAAGNEFEAHRHKDATVAVTPNAGDGSTSVAVVPTAAPATAAEIQVNADGSMEEPRRGSAISLFRKNTARRFKSLTHLPGWRAARNNNGGDSNNSTQPNDQTNQVPAAAVAGEPLPPPPTPTTATAGTSFGRGIKNKLGRRWRSDSITASSQAADAAIGAGGVLLGGWNGKPGAENATAGSPESHVVADHPPAPSQPGRAHYGVMQKQNSASGLTAHTSSDHINAETDPHAPRFGSWRRLFGSAGAGAATKHDHADGSQLAAAAPPAGWNPALMTPAAVAAASAKPPVASPVQAAAGAPTAPEAAFPPAGWAMSRPSTSASGHDWRNPNDTATNFLSPAATSPAANPIPVAAAPSAPAPSIASTDPHRTSASPLASDNLTETATTTTTLHALTHQLQTLEFHLQQEQQAHANTQHELQQYQRTVAAQSTTLAQIQAANSGLAAQLASVRAAQQAAVEQAASHHAAMVAADAEYAMREHVAEEEKTALRVRCEAAERRVRDLQGELHAAAAPAFTVEDEGSHHHHAAHHHHHHAGMTADAALVSAQAARISELVARVAELELAVQRRDEMAATSVLKIQTSQRRMEYLWDMYAGGGANYQGGPQHQQHQQYHQQQRQPLRMIQPWDRVPAAADGWLGGSMSELSPRRVSGPASPQIFEVDGMGRTMGSLYASR
ncbi:hypothetical protein HDU86_004130 [Geranomyces michiganensis]|nr:hypothetical protein HDU86_004130 [Geranomyces michiganensis]